MEPGGEHLDVAATLQLAAEPRSPARARGFVSEFCTAAHFPAEVCETAALLVSELVTNAIIHGRSGSTLEIHRPADTLRVAVHDDNPALPPVGDHPPLDGSSGRGLLLVSSLADSWGVEPSNGGKAVWFELRLH